MDKFSKNTINSVKYFLKYEAKKHSNGTWDRLKIIDLKISCDGNYSFGITYLWTVAGVFEDYYVSGNLNDFPRDAVLDGLDVAELIFYPIHKRAYERVSKYNEHDIKMIEENFDYLKKIYQRRYNKEINIKQNYSDFIIIKYD